MADQHSRKRLSLSSVGDQLQRSAVFCAVILAIAFASAAAAKADFRTITLESGWPQKERHTFQFDIPAEYHLDDRYSSVGDFGMGKV